MPGPVIQDFMNSGINNNEDAAIRQATEREMQRLKDEINNQISELADISAKVNKGQKVSIDKVSKILSNTNEASKSLDKLAERASTWLSTGLSFELERTIRNQKQRIEAYNAFYANEEEKNQRDLRNIREKAAEQEKKDLEIRERNFRFKNSRIFEQIEANLYDTGGEAFNLIDKLTNNTEDYFNTTSKVRQDADASLFRVQLEKLEEVTEQYKRSFDSIKDHIEDTEREMYANTLRDLEAQTQAFRDQYDLEMEGTKSLLGSLFKDANKGLKDMKSGMTSFKDIFDSLNLHLITRAITQGSETIIDTMSEISRARGMNYRDVAKVRTGLSGSDTFGGAIGAGEIMQVYRMNNLSTEYLGEIASSVAMFEKETGVTNEALNGMLLWAQNSGISKSRTVEALDYLQSIRDEGADTQNIAEFLSENAALIDDYEGVMTNLAALQRIDPSGVIAEAYGQIIGNNNSARAALINNPNLAPILGTNVEELEGLANSGDTNALIEELLRRYAEKAEEFITLDNASANQLAQAYGFNANEMNMLAKTDDIMGMFNDLRRDMEAERGVSTIANSTGTLGFLDLPTKIANAVSTSWIGEGLTNLSETAKNHPIMVSLATNTMSHLVGSMGSEFMKKVLPDSIGDIKPLIKGIPGNIGKLFGNVSGNLSSVIPKLTSSMIPSIGLGIATVAGTAAIASAVKEATQEEVDRSLSRREILDMLTDEDKSNDKEAVEKYKELTPPGAFATKEQKEIDKTISNIVEEKGLMQELNEQEAASSPESADVVKSNILSMVGEGLEKQRKKGLVDTIFTKNDFASAISQARRYAELSGYDESYLEDVLREYGLNPGTNGYGTTDDMEEFLYEYRKANKGSGYATGLSYVPYDNFIAKLHKGERVLTSSENNYYNETVDRSLVNNELDKILSKLDNKELQKVIKDGFEYIGKKIVENAGSGNVPIQGESSSRKSLTSMYLANQWG